VDGRQVNDPFAQAAEDDHSRPGQLGESPTHGRQEGSAYNSHFGCTCYHPLFCFTTGHPGYAG
jgi:hypothetical protein